MISHQIHGNCLMVERGGILKWQNDYSFRTILLYLLLLTTKDFSLSRNRFIRRHSVAYRNSGRAMEQAREHTARNNAQPSHGAAFLKRFLKIYLFTLKRQERKNRNNVCLIRQWTTWAQSCWGTIWEIVQHISQLSHWKWKGGTGALFHCFPSPIGGMLTPRKSTASGCRLCLSVSLVNSFELERALWQQSRAVYHVRDKSLQHSRNCAPQECVNSNMGWGAVVWNIDITCYNPS